MTKTPTDMSQMIRKLYTHGSLPARYKQYLRPYICPFHTLVEIIPENSHVLDIGCGDGLLINLLTQLDKTTSAIGFDANKSSIEKALQAKENLNHAEKVLFLHLAAEDNWPDQPFDVVTMIDVMHHIRPPFQKPAFQKAVKHVQDGGLFIYKDMALKPFWMAWANRLHDLLLAQDWIHYVPMDEINQWARDLGLEQMDRQRIDMFWYGHELCVFRKRSE